VNTVIFYSECFNRKVCLKIYFMVECNGVVFVWYYFDGEVLMWEVFEIFEMNGDFDWLMVICIEYIVDVLV